MEIRERNDIYKELVKQKKEENDAYNGKSSAPRVSAPSMPRINNPNVKIPKFY
jgi:hypothetical protein